MNKHRVNAYLAALVITVAGALAAWVIVRMAYRTQPTIVKTNSEASYSALQNSILKSKVLGGSN